jgi:Protein of unknown function, DUF547
MKTQAFVLLCLSLIINNVSAESFDHGSWDTLLRQYVVSQNGGRSTEVDYQGMLDKRATLGTYLRALTQISRHEFDQWPKEEQLAFLINAYNAWTIDLILSAYPDIRSIKDLGSLLRSPWKKAFIDLLGETRSLDDIEHTLIRGSGRYQDPRIHFAVNCASIGCPALRAEAYWGERLDVQLETQTQLFLSDPVRNYLEDDTLNVSSIFKWYREDFEQGWLGIYSLADFFIRYSASLGLNMEEVSALKSGQIKIKFTKYDWQLNARR